MPQKLIDYDEYNAPGDVYEVWYPDNARFVDSPVYDGAQALEISVPEGATWGTNCEWRMVDNGMSDSPVLYQSTMFRLSGNWTMDTDDNCRLWNNGLADGPANSGGGGPPTGDDGFSSRVYITERGEREAGTFNLLEYTYHMDQGGSYGELTTIEVPGGIEPGRWYTLESYMKVNSVSGGEANYDGVIAYWIDGTEVYRRSDLRFRTASDHLIEWGGPVMHYGGGENAPVGVSVAYDEHFVSTDGIPTEDPNADPTPEGTTLAITNDGSGRTDYRVVVDGEITATDGFGQGDSLQQGNTVATGFVNGGTDALTYTGCVRSFEYDNVPPTVRRDGSVVSLQDVPTCPQNGGGGGGGVVGASGSALTLALLYAAYRRMKG